MSIFIELIDGTEMEFADTKEFSHMIVSELALGGKFVEINTRVDEGLGNGWQDFKTEFIPVSNIKRIEES
jgi:hypothetical protein